MPVSRIADDLSAARVIPQYTNTVIKKYFYYLRTLRRRISIAKRLIMTDMLI